MIDTALILAAGLGTRLAPLSSLRAKAALPVAGDAIIRRQVRWLATAGVSRVVVNLHHRPASLTAVLGHGDDLGVSVRYSWEATVLGSAGGPRRALDLLDRERFYIINGDTLTDLSLTDLAAAHDAVQPLVTMAVVPARDGYNALRVPGNRFSGVVAASARTTETAPLAHFIGVQVAERRAFAGVAEGEPGDIVRGLYPALVADDPDAVRTVMTRASFHDIGTPLEYWRTATAFARAEGRSPDRGRDVTIAAGAKVDGTICWDGVTIGADAHVIDCVVTDGAQVPAGLHVRDACLLAEAGLPLGQGHRIVDGLRIVPYAMPGQTIAG